MKNSNKIILLIALITISSNVNAQVNSEKKSFTYGEFKAGYAVSQFGKNLDKAYEDGNYGTSGGGLFTLGAYHKFEKVSYFSSYFKLTSKIYLSYHIHFLFNDSNSLTQFNMTERMLRTKKSKYTGRSSTDTP